jgi:hypothetical protein
MSPDDLERALLAMREPATVRGTPTHDLEEEDVEKMHVEYSVRAPDDWIISGPLGFRGGTGRRFPNWDEAEAWARAFYGSRFKGRVRELSSHTEQVRYGFWIAKRGQTNG